MGYNKTGSEAAGKTLAEKYRVASRYPVEKSCPFCGKRRAVVEQAKEDNSLYLVKCKECYAITNRASSPNEAIEMWDNELFPDYVWTTNRGSSYTDDPDVWGDLRNAIVVAVFDEYKKQKKLAMKSWSNFTASKRHLEKAELEKEFFTDEKFTFFSNLSGDSIVEAADKQAKYDVLFREKHHCRGCGNTKCEHQNYIWWLWDNGNEHDICQGWQKYKQKKRTKPWIKQQLYRLGPR